MAGKREKTTESLLSFRKKTSIAFITMIILSVGVLSTVILNISNRMIVRKVSSLISANSRQIELNIDNYIDNIVTTGTLLFSDEEIYKFNIADENLTEYDISTRKTKIQNRIYDIGIIENFADFAIIYSNDKSIGWLSNITSDMFLDGDSKYEVFSSFIADELTQSGWVFGVKDNNSRVYYVKRLNDNAILLESFFSRELSNVFEYSDQLDGMTVRLVDNDDKIVYSSNKEKIGAELPGTIKKEVGSNKFVSISNSDTFINVNGCNNGWRVICDIPTKVILAENNTLRTICMEITILLIIVTVLVTGIIQNKFSKPVTGMVSGLERKADYDQLSGVLNKASFTENVSAMLEDKKNDKDTIIAFAMMDMDNFKLVNDMMGHAYGDQVIRRMGSLISRVVGDRVYIGRLGGDEFALFMCYSSADMENVLKTIDDDMNMIRAGFEREFMQEKENCSVTLSGGIFADFITAEVDFDSVYKKADTALYVSKKSGKNRFTFYENSMAKQEVNS